MEKSTMKAIYIVAFIFTTLGCIGRNRETSSNSKVNNVAVTRSDSNAIKSYGYKITGVYHHDPSAFTQGLFISNGALIESTGGYGTSTLRRVELKSGVVLEQIDLGVDYFGEGAVELNGKIYQLTWREGVAFVYDTKELKKIKEIRYSGEGWGLTTDGKVLYMSDGTSTIYKLDPDTFRHIGTINVMAKNNRVHMLNELEWVDGEIWANVFTSDFIIRIDPISGSVVGIIDLDGILPEADKTFDSEDVLNGIAYDTLNKRIYVTGKRWNKLFEIEISEK